MKRICRLCGNEVDEGHERITHKCNHCGKPINKVTPFLKPETIDDLQVGQLITTDAPFYDVYFIQKINKDNKTITVATIRSPYEAHEIISAYEVLDRYYILTFYLKELDI